MRFFKSRQQTSIACREAGYVLITRTSSCACDVEYRLSSNLYLWLHLRLHDVWRFVVKQLDVSWGDIHISWWDATGHQDVDHFSMFSHHSNSARLIRSRVLACLPL